MTSRGNTVCTLRRIDRLFLRRAHVEAAHPLPATDATDSKRTSFGTASLVFAGLTIVLPVLVGLFTGERLEHSEAAKRDWWGGLGIFVLGLLAAIAVAGLSGLIGTVTGIVALVRREGQSWRSVVGLLVNVPVVLFVLYLVVIARANPGG